MFSVAIVLRSRQHAKVEWMKALLFVLLASAPTPTVALAHSMYQSDVKLEGSTPQRRGIAKQRDDSEALIKSHMLKSKIAEKRRALRLSPFVDTFDEISDKWLKAGVFLDRF
jgi:hypothetical protein